MTASRLVLLALLLLLAGLVVAAGVALTHRRTGDREAARILSGADRERELRERRQRHRASAVRPLAPGSRQRYLTAWDGVRRRSATSPVLALSEADALLSRLLSERGYPADQAGQRVLSAPHQEVLDVFRAGQAIERRHTTGSADDEQVRQGLEHFRRVFEALVDERADDPYPATDPVGGIRDLRP